MRLHILALAWVLAACSAPGGPTDGSATGGGGTGGGGGGGNPAPVGPLPSIGGCQVFPADNAWNREVSSDPVAPNSAVLLATMSPSNALHLDLGTTEEYYGIPYTVVPADQPLVSISFGTDGVDYSDESDTGPMPIPLDAPIEGGSSADPNPPSGDRHVLVIRQGDCTLFELYNAERTASGFRVSSSAIWDLKVNATRPAGWTSADAAGLPILPGLLKHDEVAADHLRHALRFTVPQVRRAYTAPASHCGSHNDSSLPPYGTRVRLKAGFSLAPYSGDALVILTAMKRYGLILADQGSAWYITGTSDPAWSDALDQLRQHRVTGNDFEVVQSGPVTSC
ncbi:MAG TPA: hypothetical protein VH763_09190 [Gemmatimonadales bacterium]|jgi:hypothetical protein